MKAIRVQYTVREDFVDQNKANIAAVMDELRGKGEVGVKYAAFVRPDGRTFVHVVMTRDEDAQAVLTTLDTFKAFQAALKGGVEIPPEPEPWQLVAGNYDP